ncbi:hypothetical protein SLE2022_387610 [Rubroshorea leprosula]|uniref:Uncharacterized protein n=1 Tax=Rubroshorea leprosula TaxID=152421 RepID=A0AAV5I0V4_9ROSI|nr:hypothetical protein SLEP1_g6245 [Rubroshorea leprosula]
MGVPGKEPSKPYHGKEGYSFWLNVTVRQLTKEDLEHLSNYLTDLRNRATIKLIEKLASAPASTPPPPAPANMDPAQVINAPNGTNMGNDVGGASPSPNVPGPN